MNNKYRVYNGVTLNQIFKPETFCLLQSNLSKHSWYQLTHHFCGHQEAFSVLCVALNCFTQIYATIGTKNDHNLCLTLTLKESSPQNNNSVLHSLSQILHMMVRVWSKTAETFFKIFYFVFQRQETCIKIWSDKESIVRF